MLLSDTRFILASGTYEFEYWDTVPVMW